MTDDELIRRCREQDRDAQHALYENHAKPLYRLALRLTGNPEDAADALQEAFVSAFTHIDRFTGKSSPATWLYRITVNEALQLLRRRKRSAEKLRQVPVAAAEASGSVRADARMDLEAALADLPDDDRAILILRHQQDLSYAEIAEVLGLAPGTVASRLNRARSRLRSRLDGPADNVE